MTVDKDFTSDITELYERYDKCMEYISELTKRLNRFERKVKAHMEDETIDG